MPCATPNCHASATEQGNEVVRFPGVVVFREKRVRFSREATRFLVGVSHTEYTLRRAQA